MRDCVIEEIECDVISRSRGGVVASVSDYSQVVPGSCCRREILGSLFPSIDLPHQGVKGRDDICVCVAFNGSSATPQEWVRSNCC
jgi:hypothetical protein